MRISKNDIKELVDVLHETLDREIYEKGYFTIITKNGIIITGREYAITTEENGTWIEIKTGDKLTAVKMNIKNIGIVA